MRVERVTIKHDGQYHEFGTDALDMPQENPADNAVMAAITSRLGVTTLNGYVVDPPQTERDRGDHDTKTVLNIRPTAEWGKY